MIITRLEELEKGKVKVYIDEEYHFLLYHKDIKIHHLEEYKAISDIMYKDIITNTVLRRAKQKAIAILKFMDRTEQELVTKLKQADYPDNVITSVIEYVKEYHYIDDARYAVDYIRFKKDSKSRRQLHTDLMQKGIEKENIEKAFYEEYNDEDNAIQKAIAKKSKNWGDLNKEEKLKLSAYLFRKGYQLDLIKKYLR